MKFNDVLLSNKFFNNKYKINSISFQRLINGAKFINI
jgi:hypothetical protein